MVAHGPRHRELHGAGELCRQAQRVREVVCRAGRHVADGHAHARAQKAVQHLVERAVPAAADHARKVAAARLRHAARLAGRARCVDGRHLPALAQPLHERIERPARGPVPGHGVDDEQNLPAVHAFTSIVREKNSFTANEYTDRIRACQSSVCEFCRSRKRQCRRPAIAERRHAPGCSRGAIPATSGRSSDRRRTPAPSSPRSRGRSSSSRWGRSPPAGSRPRGCRSAR